MSTDNAVTSTVRAPADRDFYKYGLKPVIGEGLMDTTLKRLGTVKIKPMDKSNFVKPQSVMYELDGKSFGCIHHFSHQASEAHHAEAPRSLCLD